MKPITINNHIGDFEALLYDESNHLVGRITTLIGLDDVRRQIRKNQLKGYYLMLIRDTENMGIPIDENGHLSTWPKELCKWEEILADLICPLNEMK